MSVQAAVLLRVEFAWPAVPLWPNRRGGHWGKRSQYVRAARNEAYVATLKALDGREWVDKVNVIDLRVTGHKPAEHGQDRDGFLSALKPHLDGMASALCINDKLFKAVADWGDEAPPLGWVVVEVVP